MEIYRHILLATDLTEDSEKAAETAMKLAQCFSAKLSLLHILDPIPVYACGYVGVAEFSVQLREEAESELNRLAVKLGVGPDAVILEKGSPKLQIVDIAKRIKADLIVTGCHERHGMALLLGSTASGVLHAAGCDVLVSRHVEGDLNKAS